MTATFLHLQPCDVRDATHVEVRHGEMEKIASKWGIDPEGRLAPPSKGGFGVITAGGERVDMLTARSYWREVP